MRACSSRELLSCHAQAGGGECFNRNFIQRKSCSGTHAVPVFGHKCAGERNGAVMLDEWMKTCQFGKCFEQVIGNSARGKGR